MADSEDYKAKYERERERRIQLETEVKEKEALLAEEHNKLLDVENSLLEGHDALMSLEQEHIKVLKHQLKAEYEKRTFAEKERDEFEQKAEEAEKKLGKYESSVSDLEREMVELADTLKKKDKLVSELSERNVEAQSRAYVGEKPKEARDIEDVKELIDRLGSMKLGEAARMLSLNDNEIRDYTKKLRDQGLVELQHSETGNPTIKATKKLISEMSKQRMELRKRGRSK